MRDVWLGSRPVFTKEDWVRNPRGWVAGYLQLPGPWVLPQEFGSLLAPVCLAGGEALREASGGPTPGTPGQKAEKLPCSSRPKGRGPGRRCWKEWEARAVSAKLPEARGALHCVGVHAFPTPHLSAGDPTWPAPESVASGPGQLTGSPEVSTVQSHCSLPDHVPSLLFLALKLGLGNYCIFCTETQVSSARLVIDRKSVV